MAAVAGLAVSFTVLIVSVNKLFIFVCLEYSHPFAIYCVKNKTKSKTYPRPIPPPPIIRTIILIIYRICYQLIH